MCLIEMEHHNPLGGLCEPLVGAGRSHDWKAVDHNSDDSGFPMIAQGGTRGDIESQSIKASFKFLAKTVRSPPSAPATA